MDINPKKQGRNEEDFEWIEANARRINGAPTFWKSACK